MHTIKFNGDKTARLTETHTLETRNARISLDSLFFWDNDNGEKPNKQTILRKMDTNNINHFRTITRVLKCYGAEISLFSGPQIVFLESNNILNEYRTNYDENKLKVIICCDQIHFWHHWMDE